jgi:hypothetical protein
VRAPLAAVAATAALAIAAAGCGGEDEEEAVVTPASVVPADAVVYADALLRPEGEERTAIEAPLVALLGTEDPGRILIDELDRALAAEDPPLSWAEDVEPWLGERGAVFFGEPAEGDSFFDSGFEGAFVFDVTDADAAQALVDEIGATDEDSGPASAELVGDSLVLGSEAAIREVAGTNDGGESLADDPGYAEVMGDDVGATATLFADVPAIVDSAEEAGELSAGNRKALETVFGGLAEQPLTAVVDAETTGFGLEVAHGASELPLLAAGAESDLLRDLPGDSWLAAGFADAGDAIGSLVASARDLGVGEAGLESTGERFRSESGLELEELYEPLGDGALFASGEGIFGAGGGVVFETKDPAAAERLIAGLERAAKGGGEEVRSLSGSGGATGFALDVPNAPGAVNFVAGSGRIVIAYGEAATVAALDPRKADGSLGESQRFTAAESELGEGFDVNAFLDFTPIADLLDLAAATAPGLQRALPYLEALDFVIAGSSSDGGRERRRIFLGISGITTEPTS